MRKILLAILFFSAIQFCPAQVLRHGIESNMTIYDLTWVCTGETLRVENTETQGELTLIDGYWITCQEITENLWNWYLHQRADSSMMPATGMTRQEAEQFCHQISISVNRQWRLPTRSEWLFAYHGGIYNEGYAYSGSNKPLFVGWTSCNSGGTLHHGGERVPNEIGIYDMLGNVAEMVSDDTATLYLGGSILDSPQQNPESYPAPPPELIGLRIVSRDPIWFDSNGNRVFRQ